MSALALFLDRNGHPPGGHDLDPALERLRRRGPSALVSTTLGPCQLAYQPPWYRTEEVEAEQPLLSADGLVAVVLDGRIDNRDDLARALADRESHQTDAALLLRAYEEWGVEMLSRLVGSWALALYDHRARRLVLGRDALGDRSLFLHLDAERLVVASEESALLALPRVDERLDETTVIRFFGFEAPRTGATFFEAVREIAPGEAWIFENDALRSFRHWQAPEPGGLRRSRDQDYVEEFREVLTEAVRCRLRAAGRSMVMMSGGLDSTSVAALGARVWSARSAEPLETISWVFDELEAIDERDYMDAVVSAHGLRAHRISGDDAWPLRDLESWPIDASSPVEGPYRRLRQKAYGKVRELGATVVLTGEMGDDLYTGTEYWLADLLREGRVPSALSGLARHFSRALFSGRTRLRCRARTSIARALGYGGRGFRAQRPWLRPELAERFDDDPRPIGRRQSQVQRILNPILAQASVIEHGRAARMGVELRRPFRDRRLVELVLGIPSHLLYRPGEPKWILRRSMRGVLPEAILRRYHPSSLTPLFRRGVAERERVTVARLLSRPEAAWRRYLRRDWIEKMLAPGVLETQPDGVELVVLWQALCFELWQGARAGLAASVADGYHSPDTGRIST